jgi:hypothetical protein
MHQCTKETKTFRCEIKYKLEGCSNRQLTLIAVMLQEYKTSIERVNDKMFFSPSSSIVEILDQLPKRPVSTDVARVQDLH